MDNEFSFWDFIVLFVVLFLILSLSICLVFSIIGFVDYSINNHKYIQELERFCELEYDSFNCKVHESSFDEVVFYDTTHNEFIYDKLENILQK